jgi:hypothetical protein
MRRCSWPVSAGGGGAGKWIRRLASASLTRIQVITHANKNGEILSRGRILNLEIVRVNPVIEEHNRTADLTVELLLSAFGKKIL